MCQVILYFILGSLLFQFNLTSAQDVKIQYLANEGILIQTQETQILIDATFKKEFDYLDVLPDSELNKIKNATALYESIDIILATHLHGDHFNAQITGEHLLSNGNALFLAPEETVINFKENFNGFQYIASRVLINTPVLFESKTVELKNTSITILRLEHFGASPWKEAENVAFLISVEGKKIIHFGDSKINVENLEKFNLEDEAIDVAILPYWQVVSLKQKEIVEKHINPKQILVVHIPLNNGVNAQKSMESLGYRNLTALTEQLTKIIIE